MLESDLDHTPPAFLYQRAAGNQIAVEMVTWKCGRCQHAGIAELHKIQCWDCRLSQCGSHTDGYSGSTLLPTRLDTLVHTPEWTIGAPPSPPTSTINSGSCQQCTSHMSRLLLAKMLGFVTRKLCVPGCLSQHGQSPCKSSIRTSDPHGDTLLSSTDNQRQPCPQLHHRTSTPAGVRAGVRVCVCVPSSADGLPPTRQH